MRVQQQRQAVSFRTSEAREICNQAVDVRTLQPILVWRHQTLAEFFFDLTEVPLSERMELIVRVTQLNGERVLVDSNAADFAAFPCDHADRQKLIEISRRHDLYAPRQRATGIENRLPEIVRTALR